MKIKILDEVIKTPPKSCYQIDIEFMWGDADGYKTKTLFIPEEEIYLKETVDFITDTHKLVQLDRKGRGGYDNSDELRTHYLKKIGVDIAKHFDFYFEEDLDADFTAEPPKIWIEILLHRKQ